jgi:signal transduction histidine kinase
MGPALIYPWRKMHRSREPSIAPGTFFVAQYWVDSITDMAGFNLRQAQVVQIEDTGPGIPSGDLDRIFEPFFRGSQPSEDGTGLGLSIVKRITDRLGGTVVLENLTGAGQTGLRATVRLPTA